ncbi:DUF167 domain-containing protein [Psychromicrobium sp. YIM B11713]|uniref:DUF167 domain-containing protein n=1 Tax=Psychromicrobium sp. YIM B11713 TaxID=3145233 RepID=UPI00374FA712
MDISVRVKAGSRKGSLMEPLDGDPAASWVVFVPERAVDGAANRGVERVIAEYFGVAASKVTILRGHSAKLKRVRVDDAGSV